MSGCILILLLTYEGQRCMTTGRSARGPSGCRWSRQREAVMIQCPSHNMIVIITDLHGHPHTDPNIHNATLVGTL